MDAILLMFYYPYVHVEALRDFVFPLMLVSKERVRSMSMENLERKKLYGIKG